MYHSRKGGKHNKGIIATIGVIWIAFDCELRLMKRGHLQYRNESHSCLFGTTDICATPISVINHLLYADTVMLATAHQNITPQFSFDYDNSVTRLFGLFCGYLRRIFSFVFSAGRRPSLWLYINVKMVCMVCMMGGEGVISI